MHAFSPMKMTLPLAVVFFLAAAPAIAATCPALTVTASNNGPTCQGAPVTLNAATNAAQPSFHWQCLNCGGPAPGVNYDVQSLTVSNLGSTWEVIVTDNANGCVASDRTIPQTFPAPRISAPAQWCASSGDVTATISNADPAHPYTNINWTVTGGTIASGQGTATITVHPNPPLYPGTTTLGYTISASNTAGCSFPAPTPDTNTTVNPEQPLFDLQAPQSACAGEVSQATLIPTTSIETLAWQAMNASIVFCQQPYTVVCFQPSGNGPATISAIYTTQQAPACPRTVSRVVQQGQSAPAIVVEPRGGSVPMRTTDTLTVEATGTGDTYQWYEGTSGDTLHPLGVFTPFFITPPVEWTASYWVRVMNSCGFADSATATVTPINPGRSRAVRH
jgi:Ig-like domain-containing protein/PKD domain-containing protein